MLQSPPAGATTEHPTPSTLKLNCLPSTSPSLQGVKNPFKLYLHVCGSSLKAKWFVADQLTSYSFVWTDPAADSDCDSDDGDDSMHLQNPKVLWVLRIRRKVRVPVASTMQMKRFPKQRWVEFVASGVWVIKFFEEESCRRLTTEYQNCLFENMHGVEATKENRMKQVSENLIGWAKPEADDDLIWDDVEDSFTRSPRSVTSAKRNGDLMRELEEAANGGIQSFAQQFYVRLSATEGMPNKSM